MVAKNHIKPDEFYGKGPKYWVGKRVVILKDLYGTGGSKKLATVGDVARITARDRTGMNFNLELPNGKPIYHVFYMYLALQ